MERRLDDFSVEDAASALWALGALGYNVSLKVLCLSIVSWVCVCVCFWYLYFFC